MSETLDTALLRRLRATRKAREKCNKVTKYYDGLYRELVQQVHEHLSDQGIGSIEFEGVRLSPYISERAYVDDMDAFVAWAKDNDPSLIKNEARVQLVTNEARRRLQDGEPLPPGVKFVPTPKVSLRKA